MQIATSKQVQRNFGQIILDAQRSPIQITRFGKKVGYFISDRDWEMSEDERVLREELWESHDKTTQKIIKEDRKNKTAGTSFGQWVIK